ncbi:cyclophilin E [Tieghemostelium lacteum]|uniref:Peptidyl-prolyl cis-trans isomerase n=1 Tax=Tieghemostelium lacteum TaxID=361077 RepID=A0A152A0W5_TIELA|nr:cyclophilin E [Tieghemostelium lacteum]|eukprot:KYQ99887.1 cyclophilin E [Tieghemostelium lacteum]
MEDSLVTFETNFGEFTFELYWDKAPKTCKNFYELSKKGYYNNTVFHRLIKDFVLQGGDPTGSGKGGESIYGGKFEDEITKDLKHTGAGILSMANTNKPNTNGSQFFVTLAPTPSLDGKHSIFGRVYSGMKTIQKISAIPSDRASGKPSEEIRVQQVKIITKDQLNNPM